MFRRRNRTGEPEASASGSRGCKRTGEPEASASGSPDPRAHARGSPGVLLARVRGVLFPNEKALADRLRREAAESRPEFSESLHERLWHAIQREGMVRVRSARCGEVSRRGRVWAVTALAAACVLGAATIAWHARRAARDAETAEWVATADPGSAESIDSPGDPSGLPAELDPMADLADRFSGRIDTLLDSAVAGQRWAYLDHDARLALQLLGDRIPFEVASSSTPADSAVGP